MIASEVLAERHREYYAWVGVKHIDEANAYTANDYEYSFSNADTFIEGAQEAVGVVVNKVKFTTLYNQLLEAQELSADFGITIGDSVSLDYYGWVNGAYREMKFWQKNAEGAWVITHDMVITVPKM